MSISPRQYEASKLVHIFIQHAHNKTTLCYVLSVYMKTARLRRSDPIIGVILGGYEGYAYPPLFGVGGTVPPLFKSCHKKNDCHPACLCAEKKTKQMLIVGKSLKLLPPEPLLLVLICTKSLVGWGFAPDPTGGA